MAEVNEQILEILKADLPKEAEITAELTKAQMNEKAIAAVKSALKILSAYKAEMPENVMETLAKLAQMEPPRKRDDNYEDKNKAKKGFEGYPQPVKKSDGSFDLSGVPEEQRPIIEALWKQAERSEMLEKQLSDERDQRLVKQYVEKAQGYQNLPIKADEFGKVFKNLAQAAPEEFAKIEDLLKAVDESLGQSKLFKELGSNSQGASSSWDKVEQMAAQVIQKNDGMTKEQAISKVLEDNPQLYAEYLSEKR